MTDSVEETTEMQAARVVLATMGVSPAELAEAQPPRSVAPTFADYVPTVSDAVSHGTRRSYGPYWKRVVAAWGHRRLEEPTASEIKQLAEQVRTQVVQRRNGRGGRSAAEHVIAALRCVYNHAVADGILTDVDNPARRVPKPRRLPSTRRGLPEARLAEINRVAAATGNDPALDALLLRLHTETACRRGGALALRPVDLDTAQCLILLREKGDTVRWHRCRRHSCGTCRHTLANVVWRNPMSSCCATPPARRSRLVVMTTCGPGSVGICRGWPPSRSVPTGCVIPP